MDKFCLDGTHITVSFSRRRITLSNSKQKTASGLGKRSFSSGPGKAKLDGKIALVTGASTGIGKAIAKDFAKEGARLVLADVNDESGKALAEEVKKEGAEAIYVHCNVADSNEVKQLVQQTIDTYGRLDVACNNAGIEGSKGFVADCTEENWDSVLNINLKGVFLSMKHEIPAMIKAGGGTIVNLSSVAGVIGFPSLPAYVASKHGIVGITKNAALEYAKDNIRVNAVCPGGVHTEMLDRIAGNDEEFWKMLKGLHPMGRISEPDEIANAVTWLCSGESSFTTGQSLPVDGGFTAQ